MKFQSTQLRQMLAAEYVVGTLAGAARRRFQRLMAKDTALRNEVRYWEERFDNLGIFEPVPPRASVWAEIEHRLRAQEGKVVPLIAQRQKVNLNFWRIWSGVATAASIVMGVLLWRTSAPANLVPAPPQVIELKVQAQAYVAALRLPKEEVQWTVSISPDTRSLRVISSGQAKLGEDQEYELWWLGDEGVTSLGLLPRNGAWETRLPTNVRLSANGKVAVSLEPPGGSQAESGPSGPVLLAAPVVPSI